MNSGGMTSFNAAVMQAPVAICILRGESYRVETVNARMLEIMGRPAEQVVGYPVFDALPEAMGQGFEELLAQVRRTGKSYSASEMGVTLLRAGKPQNVFVNFVFEPLKDHDQKVNGITVVATEVTELVRSKAAAEISEDRLRRVVALSPVAMALVRYPGLEIELCNEAMSLGIWGIAVEAATGGRLDEFWTGANGSQLLQAVRDAGANHGVIHLNEVSVALENEPGRKRYFNFEFSALSHDPGHHSAVLITASDLTVQVETRERMKDTAERLQLATDGTDTSTWDLDLPSSTLVHSSQLAVIFGHRPDTRLTYQQLRNQILPEDLVRVVDPALAEAMRSGIYYYEARVRLPDATVRWIKTRGKVLYADGAPVRMLGTVVDMSAERAAEENFLKMAAIVASSDDAIISKTLDGTITSWNAAAERIFGYKAEEMIGKPITTLIPPDRLDEEPQIVQRLKRGDRVEHFVTKRITKHGQLIDISLTVSPVRDHTGQIVGASKIARDISNQKLAEKVIRESEERLKIVLDASELGTYELNFSTGLVTHSEKYAEIMGQPKGSVLQHQELLKFLHPDDMPVRALAFEVAFRTGMLNYQTRVRLADGALRWIEAKGKIFYDTSGKPDRLVGTVRDITTEKLAKELLEESERRFKSVADSAPVMIWLTDLKGKAVFLNKSWSDFTGISREDGMGNGWTTLVHPDDLASTSAAFSAAYDTRGHYNKELRIRHHSGKYRWVQDHAVPRFDTEGNFAGFIGTSVDIEEQRNAKVVLENKVEERTADLLEANEQLMKTNRELEQFAYVSSHDLQEPLRKIMTFSEMLSSSFKPEGKGREYLEKINASAQRMSNLIRDLLHYSRLSKGDERFVKTDLNDVLRNIRNDFEMLIIQKDAVIESGELPVVMAIPVQMNQLFYNLISNSLKFSEQNPKITISSIPVSDSERQTLGLSTDTGYIHLVFEDNGIGFSQEHADQIFVIFQRLNDRQQYSGTGIGLAICKKIVENHHGLIMASGRPGQGARFDVYLPT